MASAIGLFYKAAGIETGGANSETGLHTGTALSSGDSEATPLVTAAIDTVYTLYYRVVDSSTGAETGQHSTTAVMPTLPAGWVGCGTYAGTYSATPTLDAATWANKPLFVKQTAFLAVRGQWAPSQTYTAGDRVYLSGASTTVYQCVSGHTSGTWATDLAAGRWRDENIVVAALAWADDTYTSAFNDDFSTLDVTRWAALTSGSGVDTVTSGRDEVTTTSAAGAAISVLKKPLDVAAIRTYTALGHIDSANADWFPLAVAASPTQPAIASYADWQATRLFWVFLASNAPTIAYMDSAGTLHSWNGSAWVASSVSIGTTIVPSTDYKFIFETNGTQARMRITTGADEAVGGTPTFVNLSSLANYSAGTWAWFGEPLNDNWTGAGSLTSFTVT